MFARRFASSEPPKSSSKRNYSRDRSNSSFSRTSGVSKGRHEPHAASSRRRANTATASAAAEMTSPIVTLIIGSEQRIFAAHEHILAASEFFRNLLRGQMTNFQTKKVALPDEKPEIFSAILEYLYRGDYSPRLVHNKKRNSWQLERVDDDARGASEAIIYHHATHGDLLRDTVIYCAAEKFGLEELKRIALRKQGLQSGIQASTILASARYAYANTPDTDPKLRAHYLALIIRSRSTFKRSGTMQLDMFNGGTHLFFDLFVALCNHVDDISCAS